MSGLATVFVVAPSTGDERLRRITAAGSGFVYAASTGSLEEIPAYRAPFKAAAQVLATTDLASCWKRHHIDGRPRIERLPVTAEGSRSGQDVAKAAADRPRMIWENGCIAG
ncbi:hypothetical protein GCM10009525_61380 [Streptosporangium amethystogenes subsp. fukuiense]